MICLPGYSIRRWRVSVHRRRRRSTNVRLSFFSFEHEKRIPRRVAITFHGELQCNLQHNTSRGDVTDLD